MNDDDLLNFDIILKTVDYNPRQDSYSTGSKYIKNNLRIRVNKILNLPFSLPVSEMETIDTDLSGDGVKIIIPSKIIDIWTRLEVLLGLKKSGHTDTLTKASSLNDELYKKVEIQTEQQYKKAVDRFIQ